MSLQPTVFPPIPAETARVAKAAFTKGHLYLTIGDQIGTLFSDTDFADLYAADGQPAISPALLALVTIFQFIDHLADREAADAVRGRIEWKYALHLALDDPGFDFSLLSDFRQRLVSHAGGQRMFARVLARLSELNLLSKGGQQRTDSTYVLSAVRSLNRLELVAETMRLALEAVAEQAPEWLRAIAQPDWYERYQRLLTTFRLPRSKDKREALALAIGQDGFYLLSVLGQDDSPSRLRQLPEVKQLDQVWQQQFKLDQDRVSWRPAEEMSPAAELIATPHDPEARWTNRRDQVWTGYRIHLTECCEPGRPHLITQVETTPATTADISALADIQADLAQLDLLPDRQLVDQGYMAGHAIVSSQTQYGIDLVGPIADDTSWQARQPDGITADQFQIDWERQQAICPEGHTSLTWSRSTNDFDHPVVHIQFPKTACLACPSRTRCTQGQQRGRALKLSLDFETIKAARQRQATPEFQADYARRAGMEGTLSAAVRQYDLRRSRYIGQPKTELQELLVAVAINLKRAACWLMGDRPKGTRPPGLACLRPI